MQLPSAFRRSIGLIAVGFTPLALLGQASAAAGIGGFMQREANSTWQSASRVDPTARLDGRWLQMTGAANLLGSSNGGFQLDQGSLGFVASPAPFGAFRLTTTGSAVRQTIAPLTARTSGTLESALSMSFGNSGAWLGLAAEHTRELSDASVQPLARFGLWHQFGAVTVSLSRESHSALQPAHIALNAGPPQIDTATHDTIASVDPVGAHRYNWASTQAQIGWSLKGVYFDTRFGIQPQTVAGKNAYWGRGSATVPLNQRLSLVAEAGNQPAVGWIGSGARSFASLGVRVSPPSLARPDASPFVRPVASSFELQSLGRQDYVVTLHVPNARTVELSGDFANWKPVALRQVRTDTWETTLTLHPGTYHLNVRVNGDNWIAPPGLPSTNDDFNGAVGLVVVR